MIKRLSPVLVLLGAAILAYALLIPQMGFYWDELPMTWIRYELGPAAMTRYFSTNRPAWGLLYQVTTRLLPQVPIYWQIFALFLRWLSAVLVWAIVRELWPGRGRLAFAASLLFLAFTSLNWAGGQFLFPSPYRDLSLGLWYVLEACLTAILLWFCLRFPSPSPTAWSR